MKDIESKETSTSLKSAHVSILNKFAIRLLFPVFPVFQVTLKLVLAIIY